MYHHLQQIIRRFRWNVKVICVSVGRVSSFCVVVSRGHGYIPLLDAADKTSQTVPRVSLTAGQLHFEKVVSFSSYEIGSLPPFRYNAYALLLRYYCFLHFFSYSLYKLKMFNKWYFVSYNRVVFIILYIFSNVHRARSRAPLNGHRSAVPVTLKAAPTRTSDSVTSIVHSPGH